MRTHDRKRNSPLIALIAAALMVGFFVWILLQMAPHGPRDGDMLLRLVGGLGLTVVGVAAGLGILALVRSLRGSDADSERR